MPSRDLGIATGIGVPLSEQLAWHKGEVPIRLSIPLLGLLRYVLRLSQCLQKLYLGFRPAFGLLSLKRSRHSDSVGNPIPPPRTDLRRFGVLLVFLLRKERPRLGERDLRAIL